MILCPAHGSTGDPRAFLEAYRKAVSLAQGDEQVLESGGILNEAYVRQLPVFITSQGQNRAAVMTSVFADAFGFAKSRAGRNGGTPLFEGAGHEMENKKASMSLVEAHCPAKMLKALGLVEENGNQVAGKSVSVTIMNLGPDDDDDDDDGGGGGSSNSGVDEREQRQIQPHDTHADDDVNDGVASPTDYSNNRDPEDGRKRKRAQAETGNSETSLGTSKRPANTHNTGGRSQIETSILEAREHFQQEARKKHVNEGHVSAWLKKKLSRKLFRNIDRDKCIPETTSWASCEDNETAERAGRR